MKISEVLAIQEKLNKKTTAKSKPKPKARPNLKKALKVVRTRETPNPNALQFVVNAVILDHGNVSFANKEEAKDDKICLLYTSPSPRDATLSRMPSSA